MRQERHFRFELEVLPGRQPRAEPGTAHEAKSALAVSDAAVAQRGDMARLVQRRRSGMWAASGRRLPTMRSACVPRGPETRRGRRDDAGRRRRGRKATRSESGTGQSVTKCGGLAVVRSAPAWYFRAGLGGEQRGRVAAGVVDHGTNGKSGRAAAAYDLADGRRLVASRDEERGAGFVSREKFPGAGSDGPEGVDLVEDGADINGASPFSRRAARCRAGGR